MQPNAELSRHFTTPAESIALTLHREKYNSQHDPSILLGSVF